MSLDLYSYVKLTTSFIAWISSREECTFRQVKTELRKLVQAETTFSRRSPSDGPSCVHSYFESWQTAVQLQSSARLRGEDKSQISQQTSLLTFGMLKTSTVGFMQPVAPILHGALVSQIVRNISFHGSFALISISGTCLALPCCQCPHQTSENLSAAASTAFSAPHCLTLSLVQATAD